MNDAPARDQLVAGVFSDHAAGEAASAKLRGMAAQLSEAGVSGVLTIAKDGDGKISAATVDVPGASDKAEALVGRTRSALAALAGGHRGLLALSSVMR
jgi:hypothetical protein